MRASVNPAITAVLVRTTRRPHCTMCSCSGWDHISCVCECVWGIHSPLWQILGSCDYLFASCCSTKQAIRARRTFSVTKIAWEMHHHATTRRVSWICEKWSQLPTFKKANKTWKWKTFVRFFSKLFDLSHKCRPQWSERKLRKNWVDHCPSKCYLFLSSSCCPSTLQEREDEHIKL